VTCSVLSGITNIIATITWSHIYRINTSNIYLLQLPTRSCILCNNKTIYFRFVDSLVGFFFSHQAHESFHVFSAIIRRVQASPSWKVRKCYTTIMPRLNQLFPHEKRSAICRCTCSLNVIQAEIHAYAFGRRRLRLAAGELRRPFAVARLWGLDN